MLALRSLSFFKVAESEIDPVEELPDLRKLKPLDDQSTVKVRNASAGS